MYSGFLRSNRSVPQRPALELEGIAWTYSDLLWRAQRIAATIQRHTSSEEPLAAVLAGRSLTRFAGILGTLLAGRGYVPLNPAFPGERNQRMLQTAGCRTLVVDGRAECHLSSLLNSANQRLLVVFPEHEEVSELAVRWPGHTIVGARDLEAATAWKENAPSPDDVAYLLFTSGSTGIPKGVGVTHRNVAQFVRSATDRYGISPEDRFSQMFDTTFDLSVFDLFVAWESGACVCCPSDASILNPDKFIRDGRLTVWLSVPSVALFMMRLGALKPGRYPSLRWSLFCGEALPVEAATAWQAAASQSTLENLYGPTEATVACTAYRWDPDRSASECLLGIVPIGYPMPSMRARIVGEALDEVAPGETGELLLSGPQVTPGYWRNTAATERAYVRLDGATFYRTGDRVRKPEVHEPIAFVGRVDGQIKVLGHRVELGEVEAKLREAAGVEAAAAVGWPLTPAGAGGIVAFVTGEHADPAAVRAALTSALPAYAVPRDVRVLAQLPLNANGKIDRAALLARLRRDDLSAC
jgi:amino acid adenylation domain-containing protein